MGDEQSSGTAAATGQPAQSLSELTSQFQQGRADRLNLALTTALASKDKPTGARPAKGATATATAASGTTRSSAARPATAPALSAADATGATAPGAAPAANSAEEQGSDGSADDGEPPAEADDSAADDGAEAVAPELEELQAAGKKKDLRALEKALGLPEGHLGVRNQDYATYRHRLEELEGREAQHGQNEQTLIKRYGPTVTLIEQANQGNLQAYAASIERTTGIPIDKFVEFWSKNITQLDPEVIRLRRENEQLRGGKKPDEAEQPPATVSAEQARAKADKYIQEEAGNHIAFKLEGAADGVRKLWLASFDKGTKKFKLTPAQAASEFVKQRKAAHENEAWIHSGKQPPKAPRTIGKQRRGSTESQPRTENLTREQLIERGAVAWRQQKQRDDAARGR